MSFTTYAITMAFVGLVCYLVGRSDGIQEGNLNARAELLREMR